MSLRAATPADAGAIAAIWNGYIRDAAVTFTSVEKTAAGIAAEIAARNSGGGDGGGMAFLVAEQGGRVRHHVSLPRRAGIPAHAGADGAAGARGAGPRAGPGAAARAGGRGARG